MFGWVNCIYWEIKGTECTRSICEEAPQMIDSTAKSAQILTIWAELAVVLSWLVSFLSIDENFLLIIFSYG